MITLEQYLMGRETLYPEEFQDNFVAENATAFLKQLNRFLADLNINDIEITSGWRPLEVNRRVGGSSNSHHIFGRAIDLADPIKALYRVFEEADFNGKLEAYGLWMEHEDSTPTWVHLDCGVRRNRKSRIFKP